MHIMSNRLKLEYGLNFGAHQHFSKKCYKNVLTKFLPYKSMINIYKHKGQIFSMMIFETTLEIIQLCLFTTMSY